MSKRKPEYIRISDSKIGDYKTIDPPGGLKIKKAKKCTDHCWHNNGVLLMCMPPQLQQVCCHCGDLRNVTAERYKLPGHHGPFEPGAEF